METKSCPTYWCKIFIAGPLEQIEKICRDFVDEVGLCVTVTPTNYIYTGGEEAGVEIGLIRYPRFADLEEETEITEMNFLATSLAMKILEETEQQSFSIMNPSRTMWYSTRDELDTN